jgi:hypothetical protein
MTTPTSSPIEPRWPVAATILAVIFVLTVLPGRVRGLPAWSLWVAAAVVLVPMAAVALSTSQMRWLRVESAIVLLFVALSAAGNFLALGYLIIAMIRRSTEISGLVLFTSSVGLWINNVLVFSLLYWQVDRGGPGARAGGEHRRPDLFFSQEGVPPEAMPRDWRPSFIDYLFLAFSTATAFSATDVIPLTSRAKMMMMLESSISLVTIVVVAARAINVLGS